MNMFLSAAVCPYPLRSLASALHIRRLAGLGLAAMVGLASPALQAQGSEDAFGREARFIDFLMQERLFPFADLAVEELRSQFPDQRDRVEVVESNMLLRLGKTAEVEELLAKRDLNTDEKAQAILLQLAMTYDGMGQKEEAMAKYQRFLDITRGKDINDPDVVRLFAGAGLRLSTILNEQGKFDQGFDVLKVLVAATDDQVLKRKFMVDTAQNRIDKALASTGGEQSASLDQADAEAKELVWGAKDNYWFLAMGQRAWIRYLRGEKQEAIEDLKGLRAKAKELETLLDEVEAPKSEYPRALHRYVEGLIQFDLAKEAADAGNEEQAKKLAERALGNFYNTFLKYVGSLYADRAALSFEDLKAWLADTYGVEISIEIPASMREMVFKRQLDLADKLLANDEAERAEATILQSLNQYPTTSYTIGALDTLSKAWIALDRGPELLALVEYLAQWHDQQPGEEVTGRAIRRIGDYMAEQENLFGVEVAFGTLGTRYPNDPNAPRYLYNLGKAAEERGDVARANQFYGQMMTLFPTSRLALNVLRIQGQQALDAENYEKAVERFSLVLERAPEGLQRINAMYKIADAKLKTRQPESREEALDQLRQIQLELAPRAGSKYYEGELADASRSLLQVADFRLGQELLMQAGKSGDAALREQAADALNAFLEAYPDAPQAPSVMYNLGRLALQEGAFDRATELFNELSRQYADHPLGRDALYSLVKAALEEGQVEVAQDAVKRMVAAPEAYGPEKLFQVGDLMLENERFEEAADSFQLALDHPDSSENAPLLQRGLYNLGKAAKGAGRLEDAAAALDRLIQTYSSSALVFDAGLALADVHLSAEPPNVDAATAALVEAGRILRARPDPVNQARLGVAEGKMEVARGEPRKALSKWYGVALLRPENDAERQVVREAMLLAVNEAQTQATAGDADKWNIVAELSGLFVEYMPMDTRSDEMVRLRSRAESLRPKRNDEE